jgi:two-component system LytT family sensor kinase
MYGTMMPANPTSAPRARPFPLTTPFIALESAFWALVAVLFAVQATTRRDVGLVTAFGQSFVSFVPCILLTPVIALLAVRHRFPTPTDAASWLAHGLGLLGFLTIGGGMMGLFDWLVWPEGTSSAFASMGSAMIRYLAFDTMIYALVVMAALAWLYAREAQERTLAAATLQGQLVEARLHALTAQLQPHFLFNTLNAISALVRENPGQAERLLARLSELLRQTLREGTQPETTLESELAFLEKYVEVQETRFGPRLAVTFEVDPEVLDARVPRLLLQPIVENAIRHGIAPRSGPGAVHVGAARHGNEIRLTVRDDGVGMPNARNGAELREGIGLRTTRARLRAMYGDAHGFALDANPEGGTTCTLTLPLRRATNGTPERGDG